MQKAQHRGVQIGKGRVVKCGADYLIGLKIVSIERYDLKCVYHSAKERRRHVIAGKQNGHIYDIRCQQQIGKQPAEPELTPLAVSRRVYRHYQKATCDAEADYVEVVDLEHLLFECNAISIPKRVPFFNKKITKGNKKVSPIS